MSSLEYLLDLMAAIDLEEVVFTLSGGGDDGTCELESVTYSGGRTERSFPTVSLGITDAGTVTTLDAMLEDLVADIPDGDWINNEGGHGTVVLRPKEGDEALRVECDMTYGEYEDEPDFDDEVWELEAPDPDDVTTTETPMTIDDTALLP